MSGRIVAATNPIASQGLSLSRLRAAYPTLSAATLDALLCAATDWPRQRLYAEPEWVPDAALVCKLAAWCRRLEGGEPLERVINRCSFRGLALMLDDSVLIPRPETEQLVDIALRQLPVQGRVLDMGTGSGAIALALTAVRPDAAVTGVDKSGAALRLARRNARQLQQNGVQWRQSDWFASLSGASFDLIVSNPPYVESGFAGLDELLRHEPELALVAGETGLECIELLAERAPQYLRPGGWLVVEHGAGRGDEVGERLKAHGWRNCFVERDFAGLERFSGAQRC